MHIDHLYEWLAFTFVGWVAISLIATPFIGRFLFGALHEREGEEHHRRDVVAPDASPMPQSVSAPTPAVLSLPAAQAPRVEAAASHR